MEPAAASVPHGFWAELFDYLDRLGPALAVPIAILIFIGWLAAWRLPRFLHWMFLQWEEAKDTQRNHEKELVELQAEMSSKLEENLRDIVKIAESSRCPLSGEQMEETPAQKLKRLVASDA